MLTKMTCTPKSLTEDLMASAAAVAIKENRSNRPSEKARLNMVRSGDKHLDDLRLAADTTKYWGKSGVRLRVGFLDNPDQELRDRILGHMNAWAKGANIHFTESTDQPQVRISRAEAGYWSYVGTDILLIPKDEPTMNLEGFTKKTPESEFKRVVRHETGHTLGFPHEHMRGELVKLIDPAKAIAHFSLTQGWTAEKVRAQILTPIEEQSLLNPTSVDPDSIMCYQIPGELTL